MSTDVHPGEATDSTGEVTSPRPISGHQNRIGSLVDTAKSETLPLWVLLPLRAFLGFTFVFAGLQKISNRQFFTAGAPGSIQQQLQASLQTSPVHFLVRMALHAPVAFGLAIALAEIAVGLGVALGLFSRLAAAGGMLLSLIFFLTVSFDTWPYYFGSDIVFVFAWTPLVLAGTTPLSVDTFVRNSLRKPDGVQNDADLDRRAFVRKLGVAGAVAAVGCFLAGATAAIGRAASGSQQASGTGGAPSLSGGSTATTSGGSTATTTGGSTGTTSGTSPSGSQSGTRIGLASKVPVGGAASFTDPDNQQPAYVVQPTKGKYVAFSAICTHAGCTVNPPTGSPLEFHCPCHESIFNATTGQVVQGPAVEPLPQIPLTLGSDGDLFVQS
ncbi:MAG: Rieske 2Fe-2S domain-containing protein, partial [Acidimicrobiales bacterium]|jgi:thiosulfate dehydrogenase [quinone] large subunit